MKTKYIVNQCSLFKAKMKIIIGTLFFTLAVFLNSIGKYNNQNIYNFLALF